MPVLKTYKNGAWEPLGGSGSSGSSSIDVTAEVGQTIVVEEVDADGRPTKWKAAEYQSRTHWSEYAELQPLTTFTPVYNEVFGVPLNSMANFDIVAGHKYKVIFDGVEYNCEAIMATMSGITAPAFGNTLIAGGEDTGEPFAICKVSGDEWATIIFFDMNPHSAQVFGEVVTPIPVQYIPKICAEIDMNLDDFDGHAIHITHDTTEIMNALANGYPIYINYMSGLMLNRAQVTYITASSHYGASWAEIINFFTNKGLLHIVPLTLYFTRPYHVDDDDYIIQLNMSDE